MGVIWREECAEKQREQIERIFGEEQSREHPPPRVMLYRRDVSGRRREREPNARADVIAVVFCGNGKRIAHLVTAKGQVFPYAVPEETDAELEELEQ